MYDFLYDQQDIYDYYDEIFQEKEQNFDLPVNVRQYDKPFALLLENFDNLVMEFTEDKDIETLKNYRWFNFKMIKAISSGVLTNSTNCFEQK